MLNLRSCIAVSLSIFIILYCLIDQQIMAHSNHYPIRNNDKRNSELIRYTTTLRANIKQHYKSLIENIKLRESQILQELDTIEEEYRNLSLKYNTTLNKLEISKQYVKENLCSKYLKEYCEKSLKVTDEKIKSIEQKIIEKTNVTFEINANLAKEISKIGELKLFNCLTVNYQSKVIPIIQAGTIGSGVGQLNTPYGITTDKNTNNIYVVDFTGHRVSVFNSTGNYQFQFNENMKGPVGIAIYEYYVFVSQYYDHSILVYTLDGTFLHKFGTGKGQLRYPYGIDVSPLNGDIYVCDYNKRVEIFNKYFKHKSYIVDQLIRPVDVKLTQQEIFVLDRSSKSVKVYDYDNKYLRSVVNSTGDGYHLLNPFFMFIDKNGNILLSDYIITYFSNKGYRVDGSKVLIFNHLGVFIEQIGTNSNLFTRPTGITVDQSCRLIIVNQKQNAVIQIF